MSGERVLIAGCGYVGAALAARLVAEGHRVWGLRRRAAALPDGVTPVVADLERPASLEGLPAEIDVVVFAAAAGGFDEARYRAVYVTALGNLLGALAARDAPVRRVFYTSSTSVYAQESGEWVDEASPTAPSHFAGSLVLAGERALHAGPFPGTAVRLGGIYGPTRTRLLRQVAAGQAWAPAEPVQWTNRIHRDDCAGVLAHLIALPDPAACYLAVDDAPTPRREVLQWLARELDVPWPDEGLPASAASRALRTNKRCRNARLRESGYQFIYPSYREGYREMLRDYAVGLA